MNAQYLTSAELLIRQTEPSWMTFRYLGEEELPDINCDGDTAVGEYGAVQIM